MCGGSNPRCIPRSFVCDGLGDCDDGSDEFESVCGTFPPSCPEGLFACSNGQCVRTDAKCNGVDDCSDGSDEVDCKDDDIDFSGDNSGVNRGDIPK